MSEWWTYRPADLLMFSPETYYRLFELHNEAVWPAHIAAVIAGLASLALLVWRPPWAGRVIASLLAVAWAFVAWSYFTRYASINLAAPYFALAFYLQAALLFLAGTILGGLTFAQDHWTKRIGVALFAFALIVQPMIGPLLGRPWPEAELFGIAPDPTALATLGVLLAADRVRWGLFIVPLVWCAVTGMTLWTMGAPGALLLPAGGALAVGFAAYAGLRLGRKPREI